MPQSTHNRAAELHNLAIHAHEAAAAAHARGVHLTAHEFRQQALEYSMNVCKFDKKLAAEAAKSIKDVV